MCYSMCCSAEEYYVCGYDIMRNCGYSGVMVVAHKVLECYWFMVLMCYLQWSIIMSVDMIVSDCLIDFQDLL